MTLIVRFPATRRASDIDMGSRLAYVVRTVYVECTYGRNICLQLPPRKNAPSASMFASANAKPGSSGLERSSWG